MLALTKNITVHKARDQVMRDLTAQDITIDVLENRRYYCRFATDVPLFFYAHLIMRVESNKIKVRISAEYAEIWVA